MFFYITSSLGILELDATDKVKVSFPAQVTRHPVEDGANISDHYIRENITANFSGIITDVKSVNDSENLSVEQYLKALQKIRRESELFTLTYDPAQDPIPNSVFVSFDFNKDNTLGCAYRVNFTTQQVQITETAEQVAIQTDSSDSDVQAQSASKQTGGDNNTEEQPETLLATFGRSVQDIARDLAGSGEEDGT